MRSTGDETAIDELAAAITAGAVRLAAATASWLRLVAEFDTRGGWHGPGIRSCAEWLAWQCGLGPGAAREHVRVARALTALPRTEAAFAAGRLSYSKVRAMTRIAEPDWETSLLEFALSATASQTELFCRQWRRTEDETAGRVRPEEEVVFDYRTDDAGFFTLRVRGRIEAGAPMMAAIDSLAERVARRDRAQYPKARPRHGRIRAAGGQVDADLAERCAEDAAVGLARERTAARRVGALAALAGARAGLDRRPGDPPRREVVVHVDAAVLAADTAAGRAHYEGGPAITGAQARRLLCEATAVAMLEKAREPLAVGRRRRRATTAQRRALLRRDGGCARPGCPETRIERLHAHPLRHWLHGGRTDLANLVLLCDTDHGLVHDHDLVMSRSHGRLVVTDPDGHRIWGRADAAFTTGLDANHTPDPGAFTGVSPIDPLTGRRPVDPLARRRNAPRTPRPTRPQPGHGGPLGRRPVGAGRPAGRALPLDTSFERTASTRISRALFPAGEPPLTDGMNDSYARMSIRW